MLRQHSARIFLDFAEGDGAKPSGALKPKAESANTGKQIKHTEHQTVPLIEAFNSV